MDVTLVYNGETHTLGSLLRAELLKDPSVIFAAYKVPHPLTRSVEVRLQTIEYSAADIVDSALDVLVEQLECFETAFEDALK